MNEVHFTARIEHSEESIHSFTKAQFNVYGAKKRNTMLIISASLLLLAVLAPLGDALSALLIFAACLVFVDIGHIPKRSANAMLKAMPDFDSFQYQFGEKAVKISSEKSGQSGHLGYDKIERLAEDVYNYYIFANPATGYMLSKDSLEPRDKEAFKKFLASAAGCKWYSAKGMMGLNLHNIISSIRNR